MYPEIEIWKTAPPFIYFGITIASISVLIALAAFFRGIIKEAKEEVVVTYRKKILTVFWGLGICIFCGQVLDSFMILFDFRNPIITTILAALLCVQIPIYAIGMGAIGSYIRNG